MTRPVVVVQRRWFAALLVVCGLALALTGASFALRLWLWWRC